MIVFRPSSLYASIGSSLPHTHGDHVSMLTARIGARYLVSAAHMG
jgi:hypothetical protein